MIHLQRAYLLIGQQRFELAERELHQALSEDSQNAEIHALLAHCLLQRKDYDGAESAARTAVHLAPDQAGPQLALGYVLRERHHYPAARVAVDEALRLDPTDVMGHSLSASLYLNASNWRAMLQAAEAGLALDPENVACTNFRAIALVKLGRRTEAGQTIDAALARNPEDALSHANQGWTLLEAGDRLKAMEHFREALRLDPDLDWARQGIVEAMKAKHFIYRWLLAYVLWVSRLTSQQQWGLMIGAYVGYRVVDSVAESQPEWGPYLRPLLILYIIFALLTWLGQPIFNLLLLTDRFGRLVLSTSQRVSALLVAGILALGGLIYLSSLLFNNDVLALSALFVALVAIPASTIFACSKGWPRWSMAAATGALGILAALPFVAIVGFSLAIISEAAAVSLLKPTVEMFVPLFIGSQFLAMYLSRVVVKR